MHQTVLTGHFGELSISEEIMSHYWIQTLEDTNRSDEYVENPDRVHRVVDNRSYMMKVFLLGLVLADGGFTMSAALTNDPSFTSFALSVGGGVLGVIMGVCAFKPKDVQALAQEAFGNLASAIAFTPIATPWVAARFSVTEPDYRWFLACSAVLGIFGLAIVKTCQPEFRGWVRTQLGLPPVPVKSTDATGGN